MSAVCRDREPEELQETVAENLTTGTGLQGSGAGVRMEGRSPSCAAHTLGRKWRRRRTLR